MGTLVKSSISLDAVEGFLDEMEKLSMSKEDKDKWRSKAKGVLQIAAGGAAGWAAGEVIERAIGPSIAKHLGPIWQDMSPSKKKMLAYSVMAIPAIAGSLAMDKAVELKLKNSKKGGKK